MRKIKVVTYYGPNDLGFMKDYYGIAAFDEEGNEIASYGDYYHDKGEEKIQGFLDGLRFAFGEIEVIKENRTTNDY
jgi:hypothetical protein